MGHNMLRLHIVPSDKIVEDLIQAISSGEANGLNNYMEHYMEPDVLIITNSSALPGRTATLEEVSKLISERQNNAKKTFLNEN